MAADFRTVMTAHFQRLARREALTLRLQGVGEQIAALRKAIQDPARYRSQGVARVRDAGHGSGIPGDPTHAVAVAHLEMVAKQEERLAMLEVAEGEARADLAQVAADLAQIEVALRTVSEEDWQLLQWRYGERRSMEWIAIHTQTGKATVADRLHRLEHTLLPIIEAVCAGIITQITLKTAERNPNEIRTKSERKSGQRVLECLR